MAYVPGATSFGYVLGSVLTTQNTSIPKQGHIPITPGTLGLQGTFSKGSVKSEGFGVQTAPNKGLTWRGHFFGNGRILSWQLPTGMDLRMACILRKKKGNEWENI